MKKFSIIAMLGCILAGCGSSSDKSEAVEEDYTTDSVEVFTPEPGMPLSRLCDFPGITWKVDTIYGVCVPDTLVLWAVFEGKRFLPTNVRGAEHDFPMLTDNGIKSIKSDSAITFLPTFFKENARLLDDLSYSRKRMRHDADSLLEKHALEMMNTANDFFTSHGMTKYMAKGLAAIWTKVNNEAQANGTEAPNPINGYNIIEFEPGTVQSWVEDAQKGIVRVRAYCNDSFTLGHEGWAFWQITMCRENGFFRISELPALVRPTPGDLEGIEY